MKNTLLKVLLFVLTAVMLFGLVSCASILEKLPFDIPGITDKDDGNGDGGTGGEELEGLVLIENKVALFRIVYTSEAGSETMLRANKLVKQLRDLGVEIEDPISDNEKDKVTDCEIIVGTGARNRGDEFNISAKEIGKDGLIVKVVGKRIIIAGGTKEKTLSAFNSYISREMKIDDKISDISSLAVNDNYSTEQYTKYRIESIAINGVDLKEYTLVFDLTALGDFDTGEIEKFTNELYDNSGYFLKTGYIDKLDTYEHAFIIRCADNAGPEGEGFHAYASGKDFIVECSYANAFETAFSEFLNTAFFESKNTKINLSSTYSYVKDVSRVSYAQFGAKGNGTTDDFAAILATHIYANAGGQTVYAPKGAVYFIYPGSFTETIPVKTNVDFRDAIFIIDDTGSAAWTNRKLPLFTMVRDHEEVNLGENRIKALKEANGGSIAVKAGDTSIPWLTSWLEGQSIVRIVNSSHKDYIRYGSNQNSGESRREVLLVEQDGTVSSDTPVFFDYEDVTGMNIYRTDDKPITIENGIFYNICCRTVPETDGMVLYDSYNRGMRIRRSNVTFKNIDHGMIDEPDYGPSPDGKNQGNYQESYPYNRGFYYIDETYNLLIEDCDIAGHTTYYEKKLTTDSSSGSADGYNYVPAGSYDFVVEESTHIYFKNVTQYNRNYTRDQNGAVILKSADTGIGDERYWGVMSSNFARNLSFEGCSISRIDAHMGYFNIKVKDTTIGHTFHAVGGGILEADNVTVMTGDTFLITRGDYGGTFKGDVILRNCTLNGYADYNSRLGQALNTDSKISNVYVLCTDFYENDNTPDLMYWNWDFGYTCYMPTTVTFEGNFKYNADNIYFSKRDFSRYYQDFALYKMQDDPTFVPYQLTKEIIYKNWNGEIFPINKSSDPDNYMASKIKITIK